MEAKYLRDKIKARMKVVYAIESISDKWHLSFLGEFGVRARALTEKSISLLDAAISSPRFTLFSTHFFPFSLLNGTLGSHYPS